jgi:hypothetical protein
MAIDTKKLIQQGMELLKSFLDKKKPQIVNSVSKAAAKEVAKPVAQVQVPIEAEIDWNDPKSRLTANFSVGEALTLPSWGVMHTPSDDEKAAILGIGKKVTAIIEDLEKQLGKQLHISVHAWMRPGVASIPGSKWDGKDYNRYIYETQVWKNLTAEEKAKKKVPNSPHKTGHAIDFHIVGYEGKAKCAEMRKLLLPLIEKHGLRMEDMEGGWIHLDDLPVGNLRFFKP